VSPTSFLQSAEGSLFIATIEPTTLIAAITDKRGIRANGTFSSVRRHFGDFGGARFRVSLVRRSPFQASFRPMPEPFLRVHPLCRNAICATDAFAQKTAF
jgi:hypothetical protein